MSKNIMLTCKKDYIYNNCIVFNKMCEYEVYGSSESIIVITNNIVIIPFRKMLDIRIDEYNFYKLDYLNEFFYTKQELRKFKIHKLINSELWKE